MVSAGGPLLSLVGGEKAGLVPDRLPLDWLTVQVLQHFAKIATVDPLAAGRADHEMILLARWRPTLGAKLWPHRSQVLPYAFEEGMPNLSFGRLGAILDLREQLRLNPNALVRNALGIGLCFADEWLQAFL